MAEPNLSSIMKYLHEMQAKNDSNYDKMYGLTA